MDYKVMVNKHIHEVFFIYVIGAMNYHGLLSMNNIYRGIQLTTFLVLTSQPLLFDGRR